MPCLENTKINIIGDGIAANLLIFNLLKINDSIHINQFFQNDFCQNTSENSTAVVALRNVKKGLSSLGDNLYDSFIETQKFLKCEVFDGVELAKHSHISYEDDQRFLSRYTESTFHKNHDVFKLSETEVSYSEDCFLFSPEKFLDQLRQSNSSRGVKRIHKFISRPFENEINIFCVGSEVNNFSFHKNLGKKVIGHYLELDDYSFPESFSITYHGVNLLYRKLDKKLILGSVSGDDFLTSKSVFDLESMHSVINGLFLRSCLELPSFKSFQLKTGIRQKGKKRLPFWGELKESPGNYTISGLYKNGYSLAFLGSKELAYKVNDKLKHS